MKKLILQSIGGALLVGAAAGCHLRNDDPPPQVPSVSVTVMQPERGEMTRSITLPGDLVGYYQTALYGKVSGYLKSISVDKGDAVKAGQVLAEIQVPELRQKLRRARANLEVKQRTYQRLQRVWQSDKRLVAREDVDIAEGQYEQATAEVQELEALMSYTHIVAPFDGVITGRFVDPGALVQASGSNSGSEEGAAGPSRAGVSPVVSIAELDKLRVYVYIPEAETSLIRTEIPATLTLDEFPGRTFRGSVTRFSRALDLSTRTMLTEVDLDNPTRELYPGMYAEVTLELARHSRVLQIPSTAVGGSKGKSFVYVVQKNQLVQKAVTLGLTTANRVEIVSGLSGDEQVVTHFSPALSVGDNVQPQMAKNDAASRSSDVLARAE